MRIMLYLTLATSIGLTWLNVYQASINAEQQKTIQQLMVPMPTIPPAVQNPDIYIGPPPRGPEVPKREQLDTPARREQKSA